MGPQGSEEGPRGPRLFCLGWRRLVLRGSREDRAQESEGNWVARQGWLWSSRGGGQLSLPGPALYGKAPWAPAQWR